MLKGSDKKSTKREPHTNEVLPRRSAVKDRVDSVPDYTAAGTLSFTLSLSLSLSLSSFRPRRVGVSGMSKVRNMVTKRCSNHGFYSRVLGLIGCTLRLKLKGVKAI
jgi:hypothetical protein